MNKLEKICTPAKIYFGIAVIATLFALSKGIPLGLILVKIFFAVIWTGILSWLCKKGYSSVSWFLVLFPYIVMLLAALKIAYIVEHKEIFKAIKLQDVYSEENYGVEGMSSLTGSLLGFFGFILFIAVIIFVGYKMLKPPPPSY